MNALDKWSAEQCGIIYSKRYKDYGIPDPINTDFQIKWTMTDARCREVARTHFRILTSPASNSTMWVAVAKPEEGNPLVHTHIAIAEAEIACLQAIMEAT